VVGVNKNNELIFFVKFCQAKAKVFHGRIASVDSPRSLRYMDLEEYKYLPKDADFHHTALGE